MSIKKVFVNNKRCANRSIITVFNQNLIFSLRPLDTQITHFTHFYVFHKLSVGCGLFQLDFTSLLRSAINCECLSVLIIENPFKKGHKLCWILWRILKGTSLLHFPQQFLQPPREEQTFPVSQSNRKSSNHKNLSVSNHPWITLNLT